MKILLATSYPVFSGTGGAEKVFWELSDHFKENGNDVACMGFEKGADPAKPPFFQHDPGLTVSNPGRFYKKSALINLLALFYFFNSNLRRRFRDSHESRRKAALIKADIESFKPDLIVSFQAEMTFVLKYGLKTEIPVITAMHCDIDTLVKGKQRLFDSLKSSKFIVVLQPSYIKTLASYLHGGNIVWIPNAVPQTEGHCDFSSHLMLNTGRICPQKNQLFLIKVFAIFKSSHHDWKLKLFGDTNYDASYYKECCREVDNLGLRDSIEFAGVTRNVMKELAKASIFAFPSVFEGFSLSLTEAMSQGLPCVCLNKCPGIADLIENGKNGVLSTDSVDEYADSLSMLADSIDLRITLGKEAKQSMQKYSPSTIWKQWDKIAIKACNV